MIIFALVLTLLMVVLEFSNVFDLQFLCGSTNSNIAVASLVQLGKVHHYSPLIALKLGCLNVAQLLWVLINFLIPVVLSPAQCKLHGFGCFDLGNF
mmetsp:Transcript_34775/g.48210  ORF Transcript_34775/g.48210 Transcript_34775/m.48210 type:complete len:96 (-) Transcript_34775:372-659(-)